MNALHATMSALDEHKVRLGSGAYHTLSRKLMHVSTEIQSDRRRAEWTMALRLLVEAPEAVSTMLLRHLVSNTQFMEQSVLYKAEDIKRFDKKQGQLVQRLWCRTMVEALLLKESAQDPSTLFEVRCGLKSLLASRGNMLPLIVAQLNAIKVTPHMLVPYDTHPKGVLLRGDKGHGPRAAELLAFEPRLLRWLLGVPEAAPWPTLATHHAPWQKRLIDAANALGGEASLRGRPCRCKTCARKLMAYFDAEYVCGDPSAAPCAVVGCGEESDTESAWSESETE